MGKTFTLEEANRSLVYVAPIVKEIQNVWEELMTFKVNPESGSERTVREKLNRIKTCSNELAQVGCLLRDPAEGMVDFPSFYRDQPVFLCWSVGEEQADFWHPAQNGSDDRQVIDDDFIAWNGKIPMMENSMA